MGEQRWRQEPRQPGSWAGVHRCSTLDRLRVLRPLLHKPPLLGSVAGHFLLGDWALVW